ncbi:MAG: arylsulfatase [Verrucomicrobia bacterium]|nr:arylsulfatase [Verrucomicrobiota bacterium]
MKHMLAILTALLLAPLAAVHAADRPNIVVILADDYGAGSANCLGADRKLIRTPSIDRLAAEGRRFTDANTTSSVCSPTRYSLLTGRYCWRTTLTHEVLGTFSPLHIEPGRLNLASLLKKHGYGTAAVGKWHLGYGRPDESPKWRVDYTAELSPGPLDLGFDYHFSVPANHGDLTGVYVENRFVYGLRSGKIPAGMKIAGPAADSDDYQPTYGAEDTEAGKGAGRILELDAPRRKNERVMKVLTDKATRWLEAQPKDRPFFLYFTPVAVHNPVTPDKDLAGQSAAGHFGDWIHELNRSVGRILETLDRIGAAQNTLVIFASDNGGVCKPEIERLAQTTAIKAGLKVNGDFRGGKHDVWEGGFRSPFFVRWPGKAAAGSVTKATVSLVDILATVAAVVGEPLPPAKVGAEDSRSFLPVILGDPSAKGREDLIVHSADGTFALRKGPWKWIEGVPVDEIAAGARKSRQAQHRPQLYNLELDPAETKDVSGQHPEVVAELKSLLERYRDGGYSRELPPPGAKPAARAIATLAPVEGQPLLREPLEALPGRPWTVSAGEWTARDGGVWAAPKAQADKPAQLKAGVEFAQGTIDFEVNFKGANRISLRVERPEGSFRLVISRTLTSLAKNPSKGEGQEATVEIAERRLNLESAKWYPVRLAIRGQEIAVQVNDVTFKGSHPVFAEPKTALSFLVFGESAGFRNVRITR